MEIRKKMVDVFDPTQEPDKYLLITTLIDERLFKHLEVLNEEVGEED